MDIISCSGQFKMKAENRQMTMSRVAPLSGACTHCGATGR